MTMLSHFNNINSYY